MGPVRRTGRPNWLPQPPPWTAEPEFLAAPAPGDGHGNEGSILQINNPWLEEHELKTIFFWSQSCSVGNLDNRYNIMSQILYHPDSMVLFVSGNTTEAGGFGINLKGPHPSNISTALRDGASLGEAILTHVNTPLMSHHARNPELTVAPKIFYGDLTLKLRQPE